MKIIDWIWFPIGATAGKKCIGIVAVETDGELKFYGGLGNGLNEEVDVKKISEWGGTVDAGIMINFFERAKKKCEGEKK